MTLALRAHRLLCRLGLHLMGRWRTRKAKTHVQFGRYSVCASCGKEKWRPDKDALEPAYQRAREALDRAEAGNGGDENETFGDPSAPRVYPVDALNFPPINRQPRDGVTHE